ncbi:hypothetical protein CKAH01_07255 [Colletotrichum kahawae]|uniref:Uncharacterized protein n=1 Tax=Colletotrichum kahawae TaxID=34407 RepID=A0AAD9Y6U1_COLKA|nr:hypothetical protein CKAH01_07255 [Colletotrichum kahawae]
MAPHHNPSAGDRQLDYTTAPHDPDQFHKVLHFETAREKLKTFCGGLPMLR